MQTIEKTHAIPQPAARTGPARASLVTRLRRALRATAAFADWVSEHCRRIRAYQELTRLDFASLHAVLSDPEEHDRILAGKPPSRRGLQRLRRDR